MTRYCFQTKQSKNIRGYQKVDEEGLVICCFRLKFLIAAVTSNGDLFSAYLLWNNNSEIFIDFMKKLLLWIKFDLKYDFLKSLIILDSLKVHKSRATLKFLFKWEATLSFILAYTPELAPIELEFNILKKKLIKQCSSSGLMLYKREVFREIRESFTLIDREQIQRCFVRSFKIMDEYMKIAFEVNEET